MGHLLLPATPDSVSSRIERSEPRLPRWPLSGYIRPVIPRIGSVQRKHSSHTTRSDYRLRLHRSSPVRRSHFTSSILNLGPRKHTPQNIRRATTVGRISRFSTWSKNTSQTLLVQNTRGFVRKEIVWKLCGKLEKENATTRDKAQDGIELADRVSIREFLSQPQNVRTFSDIVRQRRRKGSLAAREIVSAFQRGRGVDPGYGGPGSRRDVYVHSRVATGTFPSVRLPLIVRYR